MNPPYDNGLGGKITFETISLLKDDKECICLMPLSNYKNKSAELWRKVKTFELADPKLFVDADIIKRYLNTFAVICISLDLRSSVRTVW